MKTVLIFLFICVSAYSQTSTEKYNSLYNRYETFDSRGNMISYRLYNSLMQRWETYSVNDDSQGFEVVKPTSNINQPPMERALKAKQDRYDNQQRLQQPTTSYEKTASLSDLEKENIEANTVIPLMKYVGQHKVISVDEYKNINLEWKLVNTDKTQTEFGYFNNYITFKRSFDSTRSRYLIYKSYNEKSHTYNYDTDFGWVMISEDFKRIILSNKENGIATKMYIFNISN